MLRGFVGWSAAAVRWISPRTSFSNTTPFWRSRGMSQIKAPPFWRGRMVGLSAASCRMVGLSRCRMKKKGQFSNTDVAQRGLLLLQNGGALTWLNTAEHGVHVCRLHRYPEHGVHGLRRHPGGRAELRVHAWSFWSQLQQAVDVSAVDTLII